MARLKFVAAGHHGQVCKTHGREFPHGEWVSAEGMDPEHVKTLADNPTFELEVELDAGPAPRPTRGRAAAAGGAGEP